ncbi:MAG TPA: hypothetical protein VJL54_08680 [Nitrososphaera sp.]|nr:hypothetical protein [Nitrososphaera sp.]
MSENSVRHIDTLREMEALKLHYQIRCSHHELELSAGNKEISCSTCGKRWRLSDERGYREHRRVYSAETNE